MDGTIISVILLSLGIFAALAWSVYSLIYPLAIFKVLGIDIEDEDSDPIPKEKPWDK